MSMVVDLVIDVTEIAQYHVGDGDDGVNGGGDGVVNYVVWC